VFLRIMNLTHDGYNHVFDSAMRERSKRLAMWCLEYINDCVIWDKNGPRGWNYTRLQNPDRAERSLYFTYAVSTIYLSFYAEYEDIILAMRVLDESNIHADQKLKISLPENYWEDRNEMEKVMNVLKTFISSEGEDTPKKEWAEKAIPALDLLTDEDNRGII
jgi:hypothetical protein